MDIPDMINVIERKVCKERDRGILKRMKTDGISYEDAAEEFGVCRNTVYNVMRKHRNLFE